MPEKTESSIFPEAEPSKGLHLQQLQKQGHIKLEDKQECKKQARIEELEAIVKSLKVENLFLKRERSENSEKEMRTIKAIELIQEKSNTYLTSLKNTLAIAKDFQTSQQEKVDVLEKISPREWILRKVMPNGDERRFCEPCLKWYKVPGLKLGNLSKSPFVNGGVSMAKMKNKASQTQVRISHLWNEL